MAIGQPRVWAPLESANARLAKEARGHGSARGRETRRNRPLAAQASRLAAKLATPELAHGPARPLDRLVDRRRPGHPAHRPETADRKPPEAGGPRGHRPIGPIQPLHSFAHHRRPVHRRSPGVRALLRRRDLCQRRALQPLSLGGDPERVPHEESRHRGAALRRRPDQSGRGGQGGPAAATPSRARSGFEPAPRPAPAHQSQRGHDQPSRTRRATNL